MTEAEKMANQLLYDANGDKDLIKFRNKCKMLCQAYNRMPIDDFDGRKSLLKKLLGRIGSNIIIEPNFWCDYGINIEVGNNFYANHGLVILDAGKVEIGSNVFIGPNVSILTASHPLDPETRNKGLETALPISIGNNVWIGAGVNILPGITIGNNSVIGAGSVVTKNIEDNVVAVGNPCRVIRKII